MPVPASSGARLCEDPRLPNSRGSRVLFFVGTVKNRRDKNFFCLSTRCLRTIRDGGDLRLLPLRGRQGLRRPMHEVALLQKDGLLERLALGEAVAEAERPAAARPGQCG